MKLLIVDDSLIKRRAIERCVAGDNFTEIRVAAFSTVASALPTFFPARP